MGKWTAYPKGAYMEIYACYQTMNGQPVHEGLSKKRLIKIVDFQDQYKYPYIRADKHNVTTAIEKDYGSEEIDDEI